MLGPLDYALWMVGFLLEAYVVARAVARQDFLHYFSLNVYMLMAALVTGGQYVLIRYHGFSSLEYRYYYYYTESLLTVLLFFVILHFYQRVFSEMGVNRYVRGGAAILLFVTALFSYGVVHQHRDHLTSRFVVEMGQNLYFVGVVLTYLLFAAILKLRETRARLVQLVLALGVYFSATAATYALRNLFPGLQTSVLRFVVPLFGTWLPAAWAYTFTKVPEGARLATSHLLARART